MEIRAGVELENGMQVADVPGGDGFPRNTETPIFSVDTLERNAAKGHGLVTDVAAGNNVLLVGTSKGWIVRHDFLGGNDTLGECFLQFFDIQQYIGAVITISALIAVVISCRTGSQRQRH